MNIDYQIAYLDGGDEVFGPDFGGATVYTIARPGFAAECPNAAKLLGQLSYTLDYENYGMRRILTDGLEPQEAARAQLAEMPQLLEGWLAGVTTFDGQEGLPVVKAALGIE